MCSAKVAPNLYPATFNPAPTEVQCLWDDTAELESGGMLAHALRYLPAQHAHPSHSVLLRMVIVFISSIQPTSPHAEFALFGTRADTSN